MQSKLNRHHSRNDKVLVAGMADYVSVGNLEYLLSPFLLGMDCLSWIELWLTYVYVFYVCVESFFCLCVWWITSSWVTFITWGVVGIRTFFFGVLWWCPLSSARPCLHSWLCYVPTYIHTVKALILNRPPTYVYYIGWPLLRPLWSPLAILYFNAISSRCQTEVSSTQ